MTPLAHSIHGLVEQRRLVEAVNLLPDERPYPAWLDDIVPVKPS